MLAHSAEVSALGPSFPWLYCIQSGLYSLLPVPTGCRVTAAVFLSAPVGDRNTRSAGTTTRKEGAVIVSQVTVSISSSLTGFLYFHLHSSLISCSHLSSCLSPSLGAWLSPPPAFVYLYRHTFRPPNVFPSTSLLSVFTGFTAAHTLVLSFSLTFSRCLTALSWKMWSLWRGFIQFSLYLDPEMKWDNFRRSRSRKLIQQSARNADQTQRSLQIQVELILTTRRRLTGTLVQWMNEWMDEWVNEWMNELQGRWLGSWRTRQFIWDIGTIFINGLDLVLKKKTPGTRFNNFFNDLEQNDVSFVPASLCEIWNQKFSQV